MKRVPQLFVPCLFLFAIIATTLFSVSAQRRNAQAAGTGGRPLPRTHENIDLRSGQARSIETQSFWDAGADRPLASRRALAAGQSKLKRNRRDIRVRWSMLSDGPSRIFSYGEPLTPPDASDAELIARRFLRDNEDLFRLSGREVDGLAVARRFRTDHNGMTHLSLGQRVNGLEVFQAGYDLHLDPEGALVAAYGELIPGIDSAVNAARPALAAEDALRIAAREVEEELTGPLTLRVPPSGVEQRQSFARAAGFGDDVPARLLYFPLSSTQVRLAWQFILTMRETPDMYYMIVDAERGSILYLNNLTCYFDENPLKPHGLVYAKESPRPNLPRVGTAPAEVQREDLPFRATPFNGTTIFGTSDPHYDWWAGATADKLISNNVTTYLDRDATANTPDEPRISAPDGNFTFPIDLTLAPTTENNQKAAQANQFYWVNRYHDILYSFGFNEAAGNFQTNNFNLGGAGNDPVRGEAQDGSGTNNANFATQPDGGIGRMQMFLWSGSPQLDGDLDQGVILHELTHGLSNRLIGNATGLGGTQSGGMGEGWSDWVGLALLAQESDDPNGEYPVGQYVVNNFTRGIRRYPYSTSKAIDPLTYKDVRINPEVHAIGEIWCIALWELRASLIQKYGFKDGHRQAIQLVVDGMKLTPINPSIVDARDAILLADRVNNKGANQCLLWAAFSKRGMGFRADTFGADDTQPTESLEIAPYCSDAGILAVDKSAYVQGESVKIALGDRNASGPVTVQLTSSATGDQETVTLAPESGIAGSYLGSLRIAAGAARPGDGVLQGTGDLSDTINITYNDADGGTGQTLQVKASALIAREKTVFFDNVEQSAAGNRGWIPTGTWAITRAKAASGQSAWTDSPAGNYLNSSDTSLTSPLLDLTGLSEVTVSFAHSFDLEKSFDFGFVEYSTDDGLTWVRAGRFTGTQTAFAQGRVSMRALDQRPRARIRFHLVTDAGVAADGWYLDDIQITGRSASSTVIPASSLSLPILLSVSPAFGPPAGGARVTINGAGFTETETTAVSFDGTPATSFTVLSQSVISAVVPAHAAGAVGVRVVNRSGAAGLQNGYTYYTAGTAGPAPTLNALSPASGALRGSTPVTIQGTGFTPETEVSFGAQKATVTYQTPNSLLALTPPGGGTGAVDVTAANGAQRATLTGGFAYTADSPPTVQLLSPVGGETFFTRGVINLRWTSSDNRSIVRHRVQLVRGGTTVTDLASDLSGNDQAFSWTIPSNTAATTSARLRVIAVDDEGAETTATMTADFAIAQRWETVASLPSSLQRLQVASDDRYLYSFGGRTSTTTSTATVATGFRFDTTAATPAWATDVAAMPRGLNGGAAAFLDGKIYIPGGIDSAVTLTGQHQAYDIATNTWATVTALPVATFLYAATADKARGVYYVTGGSNGNVAVSTARAYDPKTNAWTDLPPMSTPRFGHAAALIDGKLYVISGQNTQGDVSNGEVYDFSTQKWVTLPSLNFPRAAAVSYVGQDAGGNPLWFLTGGTNANGAFLPPEVYDVRNNRWQLLDNSFAQNTPRQLAGGAVAGDFFYAIAGSTTAAIRTGERTRIKGVATIASDVPPALSVPAAQVAVAGLESRFTVQANDLGSGTPLTITASGLPSGATFATESVTNNSARGTFRWTPSAADTGQLIQLRFTVGDGQYSDTKLVPIRVVAASALTSVNAADFQLGPVGADSIAAAFGTGLAVRTEAAASVPLPVELAGTRVTINGVPAPLFFVSPNQINFAVPANLDPGPATVIVSNPNGGYAAGTLQVAASAPAIFTLDSSGKGDAAALATPDGISFQQPPFDVTVNGKPNILLLFGTGFRRAAAANPNDENGVAESVAITIGGQTARVLYAGPQGGFAGLDQLNVELPASLAGQGARRVEVVITVNGAQANKVTIQIK